MKKVIPFYLLTLPVLILMLVACSSSKYAQGSTAADQDGSTKEKAVVVTSIDAEYRWIRENFPGSKVVSQALINDKDKNYDLLTFITQAGETRKVYFDISRFYGKF